MIADVDAGRVHFKVWVCALEFLGESLKFVL
jgi:hypothetical protein